MRRKFDVTIAIRLVGLDEIFLSDLMGDPAVAPTVPHQFALLRHFLHFMRQYAATVLNRVCERVRSAFPLPHIFCDSLVLTFVVGAGSECGNIKLESTY